MSDRKKTSLENFPDRNNYKSQRPDLTQLENQFIEVAEWKSAVLIWKTMITEELHEELVSLNIVHEEGTCETCDRFREYERALKRVLGVVSKK